jgi:hypothetical protein
MMRTMIASVQSVGEVYEEPVFKLSATDFGRPAVSLFRSGVHDLEQDSVRRFEHR